MRQIVTEGEIEGDLKMEVHQFSLPYEIYSSWRDVCAEDYFRVLKPDDPAFTALPLAFRQKCVKAVLIGSTNAASQSLYVANFHRFDRPKNEMDLHPYVVLFDHQAKLTTGAFLDHVDMPDRTLSIDKNLLLALENSALTAHFPYLGIPTKPFGHFTELPPHPQKNLFELSVKALL